jgi:hypothetical protein
MYNLSDSEPAPQEFASVKSRHGLLSLEDTGELIQKERNAPFHFGRLCIEAGPLCDFQRPTRNQFGTTVLEKFAKHFATVRRIVTTVSAVARLSRSRSSGLGKNAHRRI